MEKSAIRQVGPARGLIHSEEQSGHLWHDRILPPAELDHLIRHFWFVGWDFEFPQTRENLPHPAVHLVFEKGKAEIVGVPTRKHTVELGGCDRVVGIRFHPGGFSSITGLLLTEPADVSKWTDARIDASTVFGSAIDGLYSEISDLPWSECLVPLIRFLGEISTQMGSLGKEAILARRLVERLEHEPELKRVEQLSEDEGIPIRSLQRLFRRHVGVPPKWVINRFRLHEALARIETGEAADWASLAADLGYFDQSHFINDFAAMIGCTPEQYDRRWRTGRAK